MFLERSRNTSHIPGYQPDASASQFVATVSINVLPFTVCPPTVLLLLRYQMAAEEGNAERKKMVGTIFSSKYL